MPDCFSFRRDGRESIKLLEHIKKKNKFAAEIPPQHAQKKLGTTRFSAGEKAAREGERNV